MNQGHNRFQLIIKDLQENLDIKVRTINENENRLNLYKITISNLQTQVKDLTSKNNSNIMLLEKLSIIETPVNSCDDSCLIKYNSLINTNVLLCDEKKNILIHNDSLLKERNDLISNLNNKISLFENTINSLSSKCNDLSDTNISLSQNSSLNISSNKSLNDELNLIKTKTKEKFLSYEQSINNYDYELNEEKKQNDILNDTIVDLQNSLEKYKYLSDFYIEKDKILTDSNISQKKDKNNSLRKTKR